MDNTNDIKLIKADKDKIVLPSISSDSDINNGLISESIEDAILGEKVKTIIIPEDTDIYPLNYVIDLTNYDRMSKLKKHALVSLLSVYGDVELYLYSDSHGLMSFGMGDKYMLERLIPLVREHVFNNELKIYKNLKMDGTCTEVKERDIRNMRLQL